MHLFSKVLARLFGRLDADIVSIHHARATRLFPPLVRNHCRNTIRYASTASGRKIQTMRLPDGRTLELAEHGRSGEYPSSRLETLGIDDTAPRHKIRMPVDLPFHVFSKVFLKVYLKVRPPAPRPLLYFSRTAIFHSYSEWQKPAEF